MNHVPDSGAVIERKKKDIWKRLCRDFSENSTTATFTKVFARLLLFVNRAILERVQYLFHGDNAWSGTMCSSIFIHSQIIIYIPIGIVKANQKSFVRYSWNSNCLFVLKNIPAFQLAVYNICEFSTSFEGLKFINLSLIRSLRVGSNFSFSRDWKLQLLHQLHSNFLTGRVPSPTIMFTFISEGMWIENEQSIFLFLN